MDTFASKAADMMVYHIILMIRANHLDARSPVADAALYYANIRFPGISDSVEALVKYVEEKSNCSTIKQKQPEPPSSDEINAMCET